MERRSSAERFFGWWISNESPKRASPSGETFSGIRILGLLEVVESASWDGRADGAIVCQSLGCCDWGFGGLAGM